MSDRSERGPREHGRNVHYKLCDDPDCPCYVEGLADADTDEGAAT